MNGHCRPRLVRRARLRRDDVRARHVVVVPEGVVALSEEAAEILGLADGERRFDAIVDALSAAHPEAPRDTVERDAAAFLDSLVARGYVVADDS